MAERVCPWWLAYVLDNPLRRLVHNPGAILDGLVNPGDTVVDLGCGSGLFTLELVRQVGEDGQVIAVDIQDEMLQRVGRRAKRARLAPRIRLHRSQPHSIGLDQRADFVLAFAKVHEVPDQRAFLSQARVLLKPTARFLLVEPKLHVSGEAFETTVETASDVGLELLASPEVRLSRAALFALRESGG